MHVHVLHLIKRSTWDQAQVLPDCEQQHEYDGHPDERGEEEEEQDGRPGQDESLNSAQK